MKVVLWFTFVTLHVIGLKAFIVPDELPTILSIIYSNIPTLKKGTDSRIGWGFRLGDRADFQIITEFGPQTNTQPLGNQGGDNTNKRNTINNLANSLYAQRQQEKKIQLEKEKTSKLEKPLSIRNQQEKKNELEKEKKNSNSEAGEWLQSWSKTVSSKEENNRGIPLNTKPVLANEENNNGIPLNAKPGIAIGEIDAKSVIPDDSILEQMEQVKIAKPKKPVNKTNHKKNNANRSLISILTEGDQPPRVTSTEKERPLDDVSLD